MLCRPKCCLYSKMTSSINSLAISYWHRKYWLRSIKTHISIHFDPHEPWKNQGTCTVAKLTASYQSIRMLPASLLADVLHIRIVHTTKLEYANAAYACFRMLNPLVCAFLWLFHQFNKTSLGNQNMKYHPRLLEDLILFDNWINQCKTQKSNRKCLSFTNNLRRL